jgi:hypothetical protein
MPIPLMRRSRERERISLLVKALSLGTIIVAVTYFGFLYWITRH